MIADADLSIRLPDGRRLGYAEYGDPGGQAPSCTFPRHPCAPGGHLAQRRRVRRPPGRAPRSADRPGIGLFRLQAQQGDPRLTATCLRWRMP